MLNVNIMSKILSKYNKIIQIIPFILSFALWIYCFGGFVSGQLVLSNDASPYYEHTKFFIDSLVRGVYPVWDPTWYGGVPNEFFLRRIGSYNPIYLFLGFLVKVGIPFLSAYLMFLTGYFFLGMIGFYKLSKVVFGDTLVAFIAYLFLMFSTISTLVFDSFIMLIFTPSVWFFFFLFAFLKGLQKDVSIKRLRVFLLGCVFSLMIINITYIPFYFGLVFLLFLILYGVLYFTDFVNFILLVIVFIKGNKRLFFVCLVFVLLSCLPSAMFYFESSLGEFVLPIRHGAELNSVNAVQVKAQSTAVGGILATNLLNELFSSGKQLRLGNIYVSVFLFPLMLMGFLGRVNRRAILILLMGIIVFMISLYDATPLYSFLYERIFFFKYIRNFQFFLWMLVLPLAVLLTGDHLKQLIEYSRGGKKGKYVLVVFIWILHFCFVMYLRTRANVLWSSYITIMLSGCLFSLLSLGFFNKREKWLLAVLAFLVVGQPVEMYRALNRTAIKFSGYYRYDENYLDFQYLKGKRQPKGLTHRQWLKERNADLLSDHAPSRLYYASFWYNYLYKYVSSDVFEEYLYSKFYIYNNANHLLLEDTADKVNRAKEEKDLYIEKVEDFLLNDNAQDLRGDSQEFKVLNFDVNAIKLKTNYQAEKWLVYTDSVHSSWRAYVNNRPVKLFRANGAFKSVNIPRGKNVVEFRFGSFWTMAMHWGYIFLYLSIFIWIVAEGAINCVRTRPVE